MALVILLLLYCSSTIAQEVEDTRISDTIKFTGLTKRKEVFAGGLLDFTNNGIVSTSTQIIKVYIGQPDRFIFPLTLYGGVSSNSFQGGSTQSFNYNEHLKGHLINPYSGLVNLCTDGNWTFLRSPDNISSAALFYQAGARLLSGTIETSFIQPGYGTPFHFLNEIICAGLYFETGAWRAGMEKNMGKSWIAARYMLSRSSEKDLQQLFPFIETKGIFHSWSLGWGITIDKLVNAGVVYYRYIRSPEISMQNSLFQFCLRYMLP